MNELPKTRVSGAAVAASVANHYGLTLEQLGSRSRKKRFLCPRDIAAYAVYNLCDHMSLGATGRILGGRDHSTICDSLKRAEALLEIDQHAQVWIAVQREFRRVSLAQNLRMLDGQISEAKGRVRDLRRERADILKAQQVAA